jgi:hypothetical protein
MEGILEGNHGWTACGMACNLDGILHRFCTAVDLHGLFWKGSGCHRIESLCQFYIRFVHNHMETGMNEFLNLVLDGFDHLFIAVTDIVHTDATRKVDIFFPFDIRDDGTLCFFSKDWMDIERALWDMFISFF